MPACFAVAASDTSVTPCGTARRRACAGDATAVRRVRLLEEDDLEPDFDETSMLLHDRRKASRIFTGTSAA